MSPRRLSGALLALAFATLGLAVTPGAAPAARAVTGSPPVTAPDSVVVYQGNATIVSPLRNDTDADGDTLAVCRMGEDVPRGLHVESLGDSVGIFARHSVKPGAYTITYYACDFSTLTPGTLTVQVRKVPTPKVHKLAEPGRIKVRNPADFSIEFFYGDPHAEEPAGTLRIAKHSSVVIRVHTTRIIWIAFSPRHGILVGHGRVNGIKVGGHADRHVGHVTLSPRLAKFWRSAQDTA